MPRKATGELRALADGWEARITIEGTNRTSYVLAFPKNKRAQADARRAAMADFAARLRRAKRTDKTHDLLLMAAAARRDDEWVAIVTAVDELCGGNTQADNDAPTWVDFAGEWTSGKLNERFPDHVPVKDATRDEGIIRNHIEPVIGALRLDLFSLTHADQIMARLPRTLESSTRRHVAQVLSRVCNLAVYPGRHIKASPIPKGWLPKVKFSKAKDFPYPSEDATLMRATESRVPLVRRLLWGFLAREGCRVSEATGLRWGDVDLAHGLVNLDENKTDDPRRWAMGPDVVRALKAWRERYHEGADGNDHVFSERSVPIADVAGLADVFRADLKAAGVERRSLYEGSSTRLRVRVHDLRALFVTHALANGRTETWVMDRTGHRSSQMIQRYRRSARQWEEASLGTLVPLDRAISELASEAPPAEETGPGNGQETAGHDGGPASRPVSEDAFPDDLAGAEFSGKQARFSNLPVAGSIPAGHAREIRRSSA